MSVTTFLHRNIWQKLPRNLRRTSLLAPLDAGDLDSFRFCLYGGFATGTKQKQSGWRPPQVASVCGASAE